MRGTLRSLLLGCAALLGWAASLGAQEIAPVTVEGRSVFSVVATPAEGAAQRAQRLQAALQDRIQSDQPLAPLRVVPTDSAAAIVVGPDTLVLLARSDVDVVAAGPLTPREVRTAALRLGEQWAESLRHAFEELAAGERARVVVEGYPLFEVRGTPEQRAGRRAAAIGLGVAALAARPGATPRVRAVGPVVRADGEALLEVSPADAAAYDASPPELARRWAADVERVVERLRRQSSPTFWLRSLGLALAGAALAALLHWALRRLNRHLVQRALGGAGSGRAWGLGPVLLGLAITLLQFVVWMALVLWVLWLIPRTRALPFAAGDYALRSLERAALWLVGDGLVVVLVMVLTFFVARFAGALVRRLMQAAAERREGRASQRIGTLGATLAATAQLIVFGFGVIAVLLVLGESPGPILASAGVAGIAIGFGVQSLIRDFFTGVFILLEDQYGVGDVVKVGDVAGTVERFTLRITQLRGLDGSLTSIPNGEIKTVTNLSKDWAQAVVDVEIALDEDVDRATAVIAQTAKGLADEWRDRIKAEPQVLGVETVDPVKRALTLRVLVRTAPMEQWAVARELRRRTLDALQGAGIRVPPRAVMPMFDPEEGGARG